MFGNFIISSFALIIASIIAVVMLVGVAGLIGTLGTFLVLWPIQVGMMCDCHYHVDIITS